MSRDVTRLLQEMSDGNRAVVDELMPLVYAELRRLAGSFLRGERVGHTLQPTALVNEAYLRLIDQRRVRWRNRAHFFGIAARLMRRILVDHARRRQAAKRGGDAIVLTLDEALIADETDVDLVALDDALRGLGEMDPDLVRLVEMRFFGGLTIEETAEAMGVSPATVKREWSTARAWLHRELGSTS